MIDLLGSLIFGVGQLAVGVFLVAHGAREHRWRRLGVFIAMLAGAWFVTSGVAELVVSGMEMAQRLGHGLSASTFNLWRGRADTLLLVVTLILVVVGLIYVAAHRAGLLERIG